MPVQTLSEFIEGLSFSRLLDNDQLDEVRRRPEAPAEDLSAVGRFLQERGWLTRYQVQEIRAGRAGALTFGGYRILERLPDAPAGDVFKAYHPALHRPVVLRWIRPEWLAPADSVPDYLRRAQAVSLVSHSHLVNVLDAEVLGGVLYVVTDYLDATDLDFFVRTMGALPVPLACEYVRQAALGLQTAHERGLFHGDLHPSRLWLSPVVRAPSHSRPGEINVRPAPNSGVRVEGVGLMPNRPPIGETALAQGPLSGTIEYLAPERLSRASPDLRSDLYSLGACFYFLLAARPPFSAPTPLEVLVQVRQAEPTPIDSLRGDLPGPVADLVRRLLAKEASLRPFSAGEVAEALKPFGLAGPGPDAAPVAVPVLLANETDTQLNPFPGIMAEHAATEPAPRVDTQPPPDHHAANGDNPFGGPFFAEQAGPAEQEHHDPFATQPEDLTAGAEPVPPKTRPQKAQSRTGLLVMGALLHLTAIGLLIAYVAGAFNKSEPPPTEPEKPKKMKRKSEAQTKPFNWATAWSARTTGPR